MNANIFDRIPWKVFALLCLALPSIAVVGVRRAKPLPKPARDVSAATPMGTPAPVQANFTGPTQEEIQLAAAYSGFESTLEFGPSPMVSVVDVARPMDTPKIDDHKIAPAESGKSFTVSSILRSRGGAIAIVAGKVRKVGDVLPGGVKITAINADKGEVMIIDAKGESQVLTLPRASASE